MFQPLVEV